MKPAIKYFLFIVDRLNLVMAIAMAGWLVVLSVFITLNALTRWYGFYFPGLLEIARFSLIWITFCGAAWLLSRNGHISVNFLVARLNPKTTAILDIATCSINVLFLAVIAWYGAKVTISHFQTNFIMADSVLGIPKAPVEVIIPVGFALLVIELFRKVHRRWQDLKTPERR